MDTPGYEDRVVDGSSQINTDVLIMVADELAKKYDNGYKLTAVLYFHDISQARLIGLDKTVRKNSELGQ